MLLGSGVGGQMVGGDRAETLIGGGVDGVIELQGVALTQISENSFV